MLAPGLLLNTVGLGLFCWLIFTLAVYALPFFVAINAGIWLPQWRRFARRAASCRRRRWHVPCDRSNRVRHDSVSDLACHHCGGVCFAGRICWLSCRSCDDANRGAVARLAGGLRLRRCGLHRRHSVDATGRLHGAPTSRTGQGGRQQSSASSRGRHARRDDLFTLIVEQVRVNRREGCSGLDRKNAIVFPRSTPTGWVDLSPAPHRRARTLLSAVALGNDSAILRIMFLFLRPTVQTSCTASPRLATSSPTIAFQHATHRASVMA